MTTKPAKTKKPTLAEKRQAFIDNLVKTYNKKSGSSYPIEIDTIKCSIDRYIKASKEHRIICNIESVSSSGMSRVIKFLEISHGSPRDERGKQYGLLTFWALFTALGYRQAGRDGFRVHGCGMDMVFATHYDIIWRFHHAGFIDRKTCDKLAQKTPHKI